MSDCSPSPPGDAGRDFDLNVRFQDEIHTNLNFAFPTNNNQVFKFLFQSQNKMEDQNALDFIVGLRPKVLFVGKTFILISSIMGLGEYQKMTFIHIAVRLDCKGKA